MYKILKLLFLLCFINFSIIYANSAFAELSPSFYSNLKQCKPHYEFDKDSATAVKISGMQNGTCTITYQSRYVCHYDAMKVKELMSTQGANGSFFSMLMDHLRDPNVCYTVIDGKKIPYGD